MTTFFFDIGDTLATPIFSGPLLVGFSVLPGVFDVLERVRTQHARLGIISYAGPTPDDRDRATAALADCGLSAYFESRLMVYARKDSPEPFAAAAAAAAVPPRECIFVGENSAERLYAATAGMRVAPHPKVALEVAGGETVYYLRVVLTAHPATIDWATLVSDLAMVPVRIAAGTAPEMIAIGTQSAADALRSRAQLDVTVLRPVDDPTPTDAYLVRDDQRLAPRAVSSTAMSAFAFLAGQGYTDHILGETVDGVYLALPPTVTVDSIHLPGSRHGHNERLVPDLTLLRPFSGRVAFAEARPAAFTRVASVLAADQYEALAAVITADAIKRHHERYAGLAPLPPDSHPIASRHIAHPQNEVVVAALKEAFEAIGGEDIKVRLHRFQHQNLVLHNVEAEFTGSASDAAVLVTAHLDSTGAFGRFTSMSGSERAYDPLHDPAPGADDDASGIAAVLVMAELVLTLRRARKAERTIRFVLFNAEEQGLVGSKAYARDQAARGEPIAAVLQMDMIGYLKADLGAAHPFEIHAGFAPMPEVERRSLDIAGILSDLAPRVAPSLASQIYPNAAEAVGDEAAGRSDHASFQERGYPAVVLSEDFFAGPRHDSPDPHPNPAYHTPNDRSVDYAYAAEIARIIAAAALVIARA